MGKFIRLDLETVNGNNIFLNQEYLKPYQEELLEFLSDLDYMRTLEFAKSMMMSQELKANNVIEGIKDDLTIIDEVIKREQTSLSVNEKRRIINLYHGYQYILTHKLIDKEHLKELYSLLSKNILDDYNKTYMGEYYRTRPVYILKGDRLDTEPFMGVDENKIEYFMNQLFNFINDKKMESSEIETFIKSQIIHFYFVYIHPYFDVNGRTSRTVSMWYLLNNNIYPYIVFNRAIAFAKKEYEINIIKGRNYGDITLFLKYMLTSVLKELEKEYLINNIEKNSGLKFSREESQMLEYFFTMNGNFTVKDLMSIYNNYNAYKKPKAIFEEKILPLFDKSILINKGYTKKYITGNIKNIKIGINPDIINVNQNKIKHLTLSKYI